MLEIHKIKDNETAKRLATEAEIKYNNEDTYLGIFIDDNIPEFLCYKQIDKTYVVIHISDNSSDFQLILGLVKTLIFLADINMMEKITLPLYFERIAKAIGFDCSNDMYELKISEYHSRCGKCC